MGGMAETFRRARAIAGLCVLARVAHADVGVRAADSLNVEAYVLGTFDGAEHPAELGSFRVPENRRQPGRYIRLRFVRLRSSAVHPRPPILFLSPGPGVPATALARVPAYYALFERLRSIGDVILLDQRGMGMSSVEVAPIAVPIPPDVFTSPERLLEAMERSLAASADAHRIAGVDVSSYTTASNADDVDDLRRVLDENRLSLLGFSYGTSLALATASRHPEGIERMVLAGVQGPDRLLERPSTWDAQILLLSSLAARDTSLAGFPSLDSLFRAALARFRSGVAYRVRDPISNRTVEITVGETGLLYVLRDRLNGRSISLLPALLRAFSAGDTTLTAGLFESAYAGLRTGLSATNLALSISLGWTEKRWREMREDSLRARMNLVNLQWNPRTRSLLGLSEQPEFVAPVRSDRPTLFVSGTLDCNTPSDDAKEVARGFKNGIHVLVENGGHETLPASPVQDLVVRFFGEQAIPVGERVVLPGQTFLPITRASDAQRSGSGRH
jgi:pimeloyl-ACP methyl ester carboxylesterase